MGCSMAGWWSFVPALLSLLICVMATAPAMAFQTGEGKNPKSTPAPKPKPPPKPAPAPGESPRQNTPPAARPTPASRNAPAGEVTVKTNPAGSTVSLGGRARGVTGKDGILNIPKLTPGAHILTVSKAGYEKQELRIEVSPNQSQAIDVTLTPLPVSLAIYANVSGTKIEVNGQSYTDSVTDLQLAPGIYQIKASKPGFKILVKDVELRPAKPETVNIALEPILVKELLAQAENDFRTQQYDRVIAAGLDILSAEPDHPRAVLLLGQSYFGKNNHNDSVFYLVKAVRLGEQAALPIKHHHSTVTKGDDLCPGQLVIRKDQIEFRAESGDHSFNAPWTKVYELIVESYRSSARLHTRVGVLKGRKEEKQNFNFFPAQSYLRRSDPKLVTSTEVYCQDCRPTVDAIYQILQQLRK
jgi:hypothetical protein